MIRLLGFMIGVTCCLIMGCVGTASPIRAEVSPRANVIKANGDALVRIEDGNGKESGFSWLKYLGLGIGGVGIIGVDCWVCKRFRRFKRSG
jgi:hypothetical protein